MDAEVPVNRTKETFDVFKAVVEKVRTTGVPVDDFDMFKNGILLSQARAYESNNEFADFYADFIDYYWKNHAYPDWEHTIKSVDLAMTKNVAERYFLLDRAMYYYEKPTLSYAGLGMLTFVILILPISAIIAWRTRRRATYKRSAPRLNLSPNSNSPAVTSKHSQT